MPRLSVYPAVVFQHVFDLVFQAEEAVGGRPAGRRGNSHAQVLFPLLTRHDLRTIGFDWTEERKKIMSLSAFFLIVLFSYYSNLH